MCVLRVSGRDFDAISYLARSHLQPYKVFRRGEPRRPSRSRPQGAVFEESGFMVDVSERTWSDLAGQIDDAIAFLWDHQAELETLRSEAGVEDVRLDFPTYLRIDGSNIVAQFDYFPPALVERAGHLRIGIELSLYPRVLGGDADDDHASGAG